jgi:hypothetical protein
MGTRGRTGSYGSFYPLLGVFEEKSMYFLKVWAKSAVTAVSPPHGFSRPYSVLKAAAKVPGNCRRNCRNMRARPQEVAFSTETLADCQGVNATYARRRTVLSRRARSSGRDQKRKKRPIGAPAATPVDTYEAATQAARPTARCRISLNKEST